MIFLGILKFEKRNRRRHVLVAAHLFRSDQN